MKRFIPAIFLILGLSAFSSTAQPVMGQYYGTLRDVGINYQDRQINFDPNQPNYRYMNANTDVQLRAGKMLSEQYALGFGLLLGYVATDGPNGFVDAYRTGFSVMGRRWIPAYKSLVAHVDVQSAYLRQWTGTGMVNDAHEISLGISPGLSWFFRPKWALEGRMMGLSMNYRESESFDVPVGKSFYTIYNLNPFQMRFALSRFF